MDFSQQRCVVWCGGSENELLDGHFVRVGLANFVLDIFPFDGLHRVLLALDAHAPDAKLLHEDINAALYLAAAAIHLRHTVVENHAVHLRAHAFEIRLILGWWNFERDDMQPGPSPYLILRQYTR